MQSGKEWEGMLPGRRGAKGGDAIIVSHTLLLMRGSMADTDKVFAGSIPAIDDRYLGPLIFVVWLTDAR